MTCGKERLPQATVTPPAPSAPPIAPPAAPAPPGYAPVPARPSPLGAFFGRAFRGDWAGAAQAALWPVGLLLIAAVALAIPSYGQSGDDAVVIGFGDRMRIALALLLQALGGGFEVKGGAQPDFGFGDGGGGVDGGGSLSLIPLTITALWIGALFIGVRVLRSRLAARGPAAPTVGLEAAVRVAVLVTAAVLLLALFAQPSVMGVEVSSSPVLAALGALLLALGVAGGVLHRADLAQWLALRPGVRTLFRATGTALRALAVVLVLCAIVAFIGVGQIDDLDNATDMDGSGISPLLVALLVLPNLAVMALGLGWGVPVEAAAGGNSSFGGGYRREAFGLSELGEATSSWAVVGALALGTVCALTLGVLAARRSADRREQMLAAGVFLGLFLLLAGVGGVGVEAAGSSSFLGAGGSGSLQTGLSVPDALLFAPLWIFVAAFLAPYLVQMVGAGTAVVAAPIPPMPSAPAGGGGTVAPQAPSAPLAVVPTPSYEPSPPSYQPTVTATPGYDSHTVRLGGQSSPPKPPKGRSGVWVATIAGAFLVGGGAAAGVLLWQHHGPSDNSAAKNRTEPSAGRSAMPSASRSPSASASATPSPETSASTDDVPTGYHRVDDVLGFSFVIPEVWARQGVKSGSQITYAGSTGLENYLVGVIPDAGYTSYDNFTHMEKIAKERKSGYRRITMERNTFQGRAGALWEYTYTDEAGQTIHCKDQGYVAANGTEYSILLTGHDDLWESDLADTFSIALDSWRLTTRP